MVSFKVYLFLPVFTHPLFSFCSPSCLIAIKRVQFSCPLLHTVCLDTPQQVLSVCCKLYPMDPGAWIVCRSEMIVGIQPLLMFSVWMVFFFFFFFLMLKDQGHQRKEKTLIFYPCFTPAENICWLSPPLT